VPSKPSPAGAQTTAVLGVALGSGSGRKPDRNVGWIGPAATELSTSYTSAAMSAMSGGALCPIMLRHKVRSEMNKTTPQPAMKAQP
jgi:hypothetical protein